MIERITTTQSEQHPGRAAVAPIESTAERTVRG